MHRPCEWASNSLFCPAVENLRSSAVQKLPDAQLALIISDGKGGMPPFKTSLSEDQVHALVTHIRSLHQKK